MAYKKPKYDAACYYKNKLMGRCTVSDSECYVVLMKDCDNSAACALEKYTYFSNELKAILEKIAAIQEKEKCGG